jgi:hypothetical protein
MPQVSCFELYQNQAYDLLMGAHHEVILGSKDDLPQTFHLFAKVDVNSIDEFWAVLSRIEQVKKKLLNLKSW